MIECRDSKALDVSSEPHYVWHFVWEEYFYRNDLRIGI